VAGGEMTPPEIKTIRARKRNRMKIKILASPFLHLLIPSSPHHLITF
jgi:hypothetical protein